MRENNPLGLKAFDAAEYLSDEKTIAEYLNAAAEIGDPAVLLDAFGAVGRARGMADLAKKAGLGRESLYKALAPGAHPRYDTIFKVAQALGVSFHFTPQDISAEPEAARASEKQVRARVTVKKAPTPPGRMGQGALAKS